MNKNIKLVILVILVIVCILFLLNVIYKNSKDGFKNIKNPSCDKGCPVTKAQNDMYKLHVEYKPIRDKNHTLSRKTETGNFFSKTKGPANIFIIRHGEKIKSKNALDCNGILRSTYIPNLITILNKQGYGIHNIITTNDYSSMHQQQTVMLTSWLYSIPLFIFGDSTESEVAIQNLFTNPHFSGKTVLFCWEHTCIQELVKNVTTVGAKLKGLDNYTFKNPEGTSGLPYWDTNNYRSILCFDQNLNFKVLEEKLSTCYIDDNNVLGYGEIQKCG
jgi:competence protein ComGC